MYICTRVVVEYNECHSIILSFNERRSVCNITTNNSSNRSSSCSYMVEFEKVHNNGT